MNRYYLLQYNEYEEHSWPYFGHSSNDPQSLIKMVNDEWEVFELFDREKMDIVWRWMKYPGKDKDHVVLNELN